MSSGELGRISNSPKRDKRPPRQTSQQWMPLASQPRAKLEDGLRSGPHPHRPHFPYGTFATSLPSLPTLFAPKPLIHHRLGPTAIVIDPLKFWASLDKIFCGILAKESPTDAQLEF